mgnify:FL=1
MSTPYVAVHFTLNPVVPYAEILLAELSVFSFESFEETETGLVAYVKEGATDLSVLGTLSLIDNEAVAIAYEVKRIAPQNWNADWEKDFTPVIVNERCRVRASFHPAGTYPLELVINPKMSFGTGHHETTALMLSHLLEIDCTAWRVLDMGCGTGVLGIAAMRLGATEVLGVDIEPWCIENTHENALLNDCPTLEAIQQNEVPANRGMFDCVIANINRNVLLEQMADYARITRVGGKVLLSGFYKKDLAVISYQMTTLGYRLNSSKEKHDWMAVLFDFQG